MAMTPAEKMRAYRQRKKEAGYAQRNVWIKAGADTGQSIDPMPRADTAGEPKTSRAQWEAEFKAEKIKAAKAEGRRLVRRKDHTAEIGRVTGLCEAAAFFIAREREDIAQTLLDYYAIDRERAEGALQADKRTHSITLETLDKGKAWNKPPPVIR